MVVKHGRLLHRQLGLIQTRGHYDALLEVRQQWCRVQHWFASSRQTAQLHVRTAHTCCSLIGIQGQGSLEALPGPSHILCNLSVPLTQPAAAWQQLRLLNGQM